MSGLLSRLLLAIVVGSAFASAVGVIWTKHESRTEFVRLQRMQAQRDELDIEWGRLKLEQSTWSSHGRVEQVARANLKMIIPQPTDVIPVGGNPTSDSGHSGVSRTQVSRTQVPSTQGSP
ncbi:MAG TPA: cell division protein FtsL [Steroidobacteraceae bacterium]|nr:cell division protein FtsL [Steroidobacteraceae bacterium]